MFNFENIKRKRVEVMLLIQSVDELFEIDGFKKRLESHHSRITNYIIGSTKL